jgi:hypothetical protein
METSSDAFNDRIRVRTEGTTQHCILTEVTPSHLICHEPVRLFFPRPWDQAIPQTRILRVEREDRSASGVIGFWGGFGLGTGLSAAQGQNGTVAVIDGLLLGGVASFITYHVPFIHRTLYRRP